MQILILLFVHFFAQAEFNTAAVDDYFMWLKKTERQFSQCSVELKNGFFILCDNTKVPKDVLSVLAKKSPTEIEKFLMEKSITTVKLCDKQGAGCAVPSSKVQKQMSQLHGLYNPVDNSITFKDGSSSGVLIHEYVHYLQTRNENPINGKVYKKSRLEIQKQINAELDRLEQNIILAQKNKNQSEMLALTQKFISINDYMIKFGQWQDLVDERSIFLLYKTHGKEIGLAQTDIDFAIKKLKALCENEKLKPILPKTDCT